MITVKSTINIAGQTVPQIIPVVQGDTGRAILFTLADFTIPQGSTATYYVQKPSGEAVYNVATIDGNTVLVELTAQSIIEHGDNYGQVRIENDGEIVTSFDFILLVKPFRGIDATQSTTEMNIFDKAVEQAEEAIDEAKDAALEEIAEAGSGNIAEEFDAANSYLAGEYTIYNAKLYRFTSNHTGAWSGSDAEEVTVGDELTDVKDGLSAVESDVTDLKEDLTTETVVRTNAGIDLQNAINTEKTRAEAEEARIEALFTQPVEEAVSDWLDDHPEATTTVQDGSITKDKLQESLKNEINTNTIDIDNLKNEVYEPSVTNYMVSSYLQDAYIDTAHNVGYLVNTTPIIYSAWACIVIPCQKDDVFEISGQGNAGTPPYCWLDTNNKIVSKNTSTTIFVDEEITAPQDGYLVLNTRMSVLYGAKKIGEENPILKSFSYVTPEMFGAKGDGIEDDTTAVQVAIDSGECVYLTKHYKISHGLLLKSNTIIDGLNLGKISKVSTNPNYRYATFYYYGDSISNVAIKNLSIEGLKQWTGQSLSGHSNDFGIRIENAKNVTISNNIVSDFGGAGISVAGENCKIINNTVIYTGLFTGDVPNYNFGIDYEGQSFKISGNVISGVIQGIISGLENKNVIISNNDISTNGQHGLYMEGAENVVVDGNIIHDCAICGIKFQLNSSSIDKYENIVISNNVIENCGGQGVLVVDIPKIYILSDVIIVNNNIKNTKRGIEAIACNNIQIIGNIINCQSSGGYGISLTNVNNLSINDNKIIVTDCNGIYFYDDLSLSFYKKILIKNNEIYLSNTESSTHFGIRIYNGENIFIDGNLLIGGNNMAGSDGIFFANDTESITSLYLINNIIKGHRWDIRALVPDGITMAGNYYNTITGILQA